MTSSQANEVQFPCIVEITPSDGVLKLSLHVERYVIHQPCGTIKSLTLAGLFLILAMFLIPLSIPFLLLLLLALDTP